MLHGISPVQEKADSLKAFSSATSRPAVEAPQPRCTASRLMISSAWRCMPCNGREDVRHRERCSLLVHTSAATSWYPLLRSSFTPYHVVSTAIHQLHPTFPSLCLHLPVLFQYLQHDPVHPIPSLYLTSPRLAAHRLTSENTYQTV